MNRLRIAAATTLALALAGSALAEDKWEANALGTDDGPGGDNGDVNTIHHGDTQTHDLEGSMAAPDQDWILVPTMARHSYEARVTSNNVAFSFGACDGCAQFQRVDFVGAVQTPSTGLPNGTNARTIRWISASTNAESYIRVLGPTFWANTANSQYTLQFFDTTYMIPRFNNANGQVTVLIVQNNSTVDLLTGNIYFYSTAGALLHTAALSIGPSGAQVLNTSSIPALLGQSGTIAIAHTGGWGALTGKSVALEPSTGFSFDSPAVPIPR